MLEGARPGRSRLPSGTSAPSASCSPAVRPSGSRSARPSGRGPCCTCTAVATPPARRRRIARWPRSSPDRPARSCTPSTTGWPRSTVIRPRSTTRSPRSEALAIDRPASRIAIAGDSAGGGLALATACRLIGDSRRHARSARAALAVDRPDRRVRRRAARPRGEPRTRARERGRATAAMPTRTTPASRPMYADLRRPLPPATQSMHVMPPARCCHRAEVRASRRPAGAPLAGRST